MTWWKWIAGGALTAMGTTASAMEVFSQAPLDGGDGFATNPDFIGDGFERADGFSLGQDTVLTGVKFWGSYGFPDFPPPPLPVDEFTVTIYAEDGSTGLPDASAVQFNQTFAGGGVARQVTSPLLLDIAGEVVFEFDLALPDVLLTSDDYFLSLAFGGDREFFWLLSNNTGDSYVRDLFDVGSGFEVEGFVPGDLSFALFGDIVQTAEPGVLSLTFLAGGLMFLAARRRRFTH